LRKFTVSYGRTVNLGQYESARFDFSMEFYVDSTDPGEAWEMVREQVERQVEKLKEARYGEAGDG